MHWFVKELVPIVRSVRTVRSIPEATVWDIGGQFFKEYGLSREEFLQVPMPRVVERSKTLRERQAQERREVERMTQNIGRRKRSPRG